MAITARDPAQLLKSVISGMNKIEAGQLQSKLVFDTADSEKLFESLLESAPDAMIIVDQDGKISIVNGQAEKMFGYTRAEMLTETIELLIPERAKQKHIDERLNYLNEPALRAMGAGSELVARRKNGTEFPVDISLSPLRTASGLIVSSVIRDITKRKEMERDVITAKHEAERANKANSAFLAAASHDLRQPVQALSLLSGALRRTVTDPRALEMIEFQSQSLTAMTNLLNSLLDISRLNAGAVSPEIEVFPIGMLIDRLSSDFSRQAIQKGLEFESVNCEAVVRSDSNLLVEIIQNLVSNGIRYTDKGKVKLECHIADGECHVVVCDTGIGIEADQLEQIFSEFHQCNTTGSSKEGFGLGLAIVRRLADLLGHRVDVQSTPGHGSRFSIRVPVVSKGTEGDVEVEPESRQLDNHQGSGFVLLIEDNNRVASALKLLFESFGYRIAVAASESEALAALDQVATSPDLLISDYHLIGKATGVEAIAALRQQIGEDVPAFIITGDTSTLLEDARSVSNSATMSKPVDPDRLLDMARKAVLTGKAKN